MAPVRQGVCDGSSGAASLATGIGCLGEVTFVCGTKAGFGLFG